MDRPGLLVRERTVGAQNSTRLSFNGRILDKRPSCRGGVMLLAEMRGSGPLGSTRRSWIEIEANGVPTLLIEALADQAIDLGKDGWIGRFDAKVVLGDAYMRMVDFQTTVAGMAAARSAQPRVCSSSQQLSAGPQGQLLLPPAHHRE